MNQISQVLSTTQDEIAKNDATNKSLWRKKNVIDNTWRSYPHIVSIIISSEDTIMIKKPLSSDERQRMADIQARNSSAAISVMTSVSPAPPHPRAGMTHTHTHRSKAWLGEGTMTHTHTHITHRSNAWLGEGMSSRWCKLYHQGDRGNINGVIMHQTWTMLQKRPVRTLVSRKMGRSKESIAHHLIACRSESRVENRM